MKIGISPNCHAIPKRYLTQALRQIIFDGHCRFIHKDGENGNISLQGGLNLNPHPIPLIGLGMNT